MTTQYTPTLKLALPVTGELSGAWGDVVNDNITSMVEQAIAGLATINTWTTNAHTLTTADGTTSESRCAMLVLTDTGAALSGAATVVCPTASKIYIVKNSTGQIATIKTAAGTGIAVPNGKTMFVFCDGTNVVEAVTSITGAAVDFTSLTGTGAVVVTNILDEDNMASDSATALATQQSIKAYVDSQISANNDLSEILANGNTTGGTDIAVSAGDDITFTDTSKAIFGAGGDLEVYHDGSNSYITDAGTGALNIQTNSLVVQNAAGTETLLSAAENGAATLYYDNAAKLATTATGIDVTGGINATGAARLGVLNTDTSLTTYGTGTLVISTNAGTNSGTITIAQGVNGNITLDPNGTGKVAIDAASITGGTIDGTTIGGTTAAAGTFTTATATTGNITTVNATTVDTTNIEVTNIKAKDGTASATIADSTGVMTLASSVLTTTDINGGTIDGTTIGASTASTGAFTTLTASEDSSFTSTGALTISKGTEAQRPGSPTAGMLRFNDDADEFEGYNGTAWASVGGAAISNDTSTASNLYPLFANATSGTASTVYTGDAKLLYKPSTGELQSTALVASNGIVVNAQTVTADYTLAATNNAMSAGPITINSGVTVTISSGARWVIV